MHNYGFFNISSRFFLFDAFALGKTVPVLLHLLLRTVVGKIGWFSDEPLTRDCLARGAFERGESADRHGRAVVDVDMEWVFDR